MIPDTADEYDEIVMALLLADPAQRLRPGVLDVRLIGSRLRIAETEADRAAEEEAA